MLAHLAGSVVVGLFLWLTVIYAIRYTLKLLLIYKGWMYESRGKGRKLSTLTRLWLLLVKLFSGWHKPMLYSFQGSLPRLPLPSVPDTMTRVRYSIIYLANKVLAACTRGASSMPLVAFWQSVFKHLLLNIFISSILFEFLFALNIAFRIISFPSTMMDNYYLSKNLISCLNSI